MENEASALTARLNRINTWSLPVYLLGIIGMGYFFVFYDISDIGFAMTTVQTQFSLSGSEVLFVALSVGLIGYAVGSYIIGTLSDSYGRFNMMLITMLLTAIGSFGDALSTNMVTLSFWRFITGMGVGADLNLVSTYIGEFAPAATRGRISVITFLVGIMGQAVTPFIALSLVPVYYTGWRWLFVIGGVIAVIALLLRFELPESPRWLINNKKYDKAEAIINRMELVAKKKNALLEGQQVTVETDFGRFPTSYLFRKPYSTRLAITISLWFFWYIGNYGFLGDAATLLSNAGYTVSSSIGFIAIGAIGYPVGAIISIILADKVERKYLIFVYTIIWIISMVLFGSLSSVAVIYTGTFLASLALGSYLQVAYSYTAEIFPTRARTSGFALSDGLGHIGGAVGALFLPVLVVSYSFFFGFTFIGVTGLIAGLIALLGPIATSKKLEDVSA
ncbi:MAG: MFS transporter [Thermoplasmataceae archaeon]